MDDLEKKNLLLRKLTLKEIMIEDSDIKTISKIKLKRKTKKKKNGEKNGQVQRDC